MGLKRVVTVLSNLIQQGIRRARKEAALGGTTVFAADDVLLNTPGEVMISIAKFDDDVITVQGENAFAYDPFPQLSPQHLVSG